MVRPRSEAVQEVSDCAFDPHCVRCERIVANLERQRLIYPTYHNRPVAAYGDPVPHLLIVGLGPGLHGANATGRPFTGDFAGILLYKTLYEYGFSNQATGVSAQDGLRLCNCRITNAVKCLPPENKPTLAEVKNCNSYLRVELAELPDGAVILALGTVAHNAVLRALGLRPSAHKFAHGAEHVLPRDRHLIDSYHCSRYNTQTGRLTEAAFRSVFDKIRAHLGPARITRRREKRG